MAKNKNKSSSKKKSNLESKGPDQKSQGCLDNIRTIRGLIVAIAGLIVAIGALLTAIRQLPVVPLVTGFWGRSCPFQAETVETTLDNLVNAEAAAVNAKDYYTIQRIFDPNARIRNRMNDKNAAEKNLEFPSPKAYYADTLFPTTTITGAIHSTITLVPPGIQSAEAWMTSASSGYANGVKYDNPPGSDHWRFIKNKDGCWVVAEFDFNASHIRFP